MCECLEATQQQEVWLPINLRRLASCTPSYKIAFALNELVTLSSEFSKKKAPNCQASVLRTDPKALLMVYKVVCGESYSDPKGHKVSIKFDPSQIEGESTVDNLDVRVACTCPAFLYWGAQWNLYDGDSLYGKPRPMLQPPTEGKRFQFVICKHVKVAADRVTPVIDRLLNKYRDEDAKQKQKDVDKILQKHEPAAEPKAPAKGKNVKVVDDEPTTKITPKKVTPAPAPPPPVKKGPAPKEEPVKKGPGKKEEPVKKAPVKEEPKRPTAPAKKEITRNNPKNPVKQYGPAKNITVHDDDDDDQGIIKINRLLKDLSSLFPTQED